MTLGMALVHRPTDAERERGQTLLMEVSDVFLRQGYGLGELPLVNVYLAGEWFRRGDRDEAIPLMRAAADVTAVASCVGWRACGPGAACPAVGTAGAGATVDSSTGIGIGAAAVIISGAVVPPGTAWSAESPRTARTLESAGGRYKR
jgi:hypothetical protein